MKKSRRHQHDEQRKLDSKVENQIKLEKEMCVYLYLLVDSCLSGYTGVTACVRSRGHKGGGKLHY